MTRLLKIGFLAITSFGLGVLVTLLVARQYPVLRLIPSDAEFSCLKGAFDQSKQWTWWVHEETSRITRVRAGRHFGSYAPWQIEVELSKGLFAIDDQSFDEHGELMFAGIRSVSGTFQKCGDHAVLEYFQSSGFKVLE